MSLENKRLGEVELFDIMHFKRVVRLPLADIRIVPKKSDLSVITTGSKGKVVGVIQGLFVKRLTQASAPKPERKAPAGSSVEMFKSFQVGMEDPTSKVLPAALKKYKINAHWSQYELYIMYGDTERCLGRSEKPLVLFKELEKEGKKPFFTLKKIESLPTAKTDAYDTHDLDNTLNTS